VVSRVANFAIDLPDASMAVQVSGSFGSRQEEAQRLGRILRPKGLRSNERRPMSHRTGGSGTNGLNEKPNRNALFFTLVSRHTVEEDFAANRQIFLAEQGYKYSIQHWDIENGQ
jgi:DNA excision repair protein ERCC-3